MSKKLYPFARIEKDEIPDGAFVIQQVTDDLQINIVRYDFVNLMNVLQGNDPTTEVKGLPELSIDQLRRILKITTQNIIEVNIAK